MAYMVGQIFPYRVRFGIVCNEFVHENMKQIETLLSSNRDKKINLFVYRYGGV